MAKKQLTDLYTVRDQVVVQLHYVCPNTKQRNAVLVDHFNVRGGCSGHPAGEYCYCDSPSADIVFECVLCGLSHTFDVGT